jgi:hypothetical protein
MSVDLRALVSVGLAVAAALAAGRLFGPESALADWRVLESNSPNYPVDMLLPEEVKPRLGQDCHVRALNTRTDVTKLFEGPSSKGRTVAGTREDFGLPPC